MDKTWIKHRTGKKYFTSFSVLVIILIPIILFTTNNNVEILPIESNLEKLKYDELSDYQRRIIDDWLNLSVSAEGSVEHTLTNKTGTRQHARTAEGFFYRNASGDFANGLLILDWLLSIQNQNRSDPMFGNWPTTLSNDRKDANWREFLGIDLIIIWENYHQSFPPEIQIKLRTALIYAAEGSMQRNVDAGYTNIALMSAALMEYVGTSFDYQQIKTAGINKAWTIFRLFKEKNVFEEYNSPTYCGVDMVGLAFWREFGRSEEIRMMGAEMESALWNETVAFYHAEMHNLCGPYVRGYGLDMQKYFAIIGIWLSIALDNETLSPIPNIFNEGYDSIPGYYEISNIIPILHLGWSIPKDTQPGFYRFSHDRFLQRETSAFAITAMITKNWMMGGLSGNRRNWIQSKVGTLHWKINNSETLLDEIGWMVIPGTGNVDVKINQTSMALFGTESGGKIFLIFQGHGLNDSMFNEPQWNLPGITLDPHINTETYRIYTNSSTAIGSAWGISGEIQNPVILELTTSSAWPLHRAVCELTVQ